MTVRQACNSKGSRRGRRTQRRTRRPTNSRQRAVGARCGASHCARRPPLPAISRRAAATAAVAGRPCLMPGPTHPTTPNTALAHTPAAHPSARRRRQKKPLNSRAGS